MVVSLSVDSNIRMGLYCGFSSVVDSLAFITSSSVTTVGRAGARARNSSWDLRLYGRKARRQQPKLNTAFMNSWYDWRMDAIVFSGIVTVRSMKQMGRHNLKIVNELAGQYEENFEDVKKQLLNYFTYKAVRTVLNQLYEMNPTQYRWFYDFVVTNKPEDGKIFLRRLVKEKQELAERVMMTRLHLYGKWVKKYDHAEMYQHISDQNLELMRERLMETVKWPSDDTNMERIG